MEATKDLDYLQHKDHLVVLEATAVVEQVGYWSDYGIDFPEAEILDYLPKQPYELHCWDCGLKLTGFDIGDV